MPPAVRPALAAAPARSALSRRRWLGGAAASAALCAWPALAQPRAAARGDLSVVQLADLSPAQQDVSRDFLSGSRAAWQEFNLAGGLRGRPVRHTTLELDGSAAALAEAWRSTRENPDCLLLTGTTGDAMAGELAALMRASGERMAHVAPWLQNGEAEPDPQTFAIFASRQEQIAHAMRSLSVVGTPEIGVVYASTKDRALYQGSVQRAATALRLAWRTVPQDALQNLPAIVLFVGGTPELVTFCQRLARATAAGRQQFVVALADANLQTLAQAGVPANIPVIAAQPVPVVTAAAPIVRQYREALSRLFDEAPTPLSLAGYLAARYTIAVLRGMEGAYTRQNVLAAFSRRADLDLGGYRVSYNSQGAGSVFVTQSMLARDGRLVG